MTEPRHIATILGYHQLLATIRARKEELKMSDKDLDNVAGLATGHWSKIISGRKSLGPLSLGRILRGVGLKLIAQEDVEGTAKIAELYLPRAEQQVRKRDCTPIAVHIRVTRRFLRKIGAKGGTNSRRNLGKRKRRELARRAARARWAATRATPSAKPLIKTSAEPCAS